jgi:hypothetical protein
MNPPNHPDFDDFAAADVYAGDLTIADPLTAPATKAFLFSIEAEAHPNVLARVAGIFDIANVAPRSANLRRESSERVKISIGIELANAFTADMIRRKLEQLTCTLSVELIAE